ncbi:hypothetical protein ZIOFF_003552 [Zingiber officinale]|uniref:ATP synthase 24 kDa subunit, mitochondrial n=1 Tax=Zingiber officinale TaxID=94328 RepID=A0A8J5I6N8_ZINOF|nr:hypothetical protein ZIOFF_003552 [Zingiber officinale]
MFGGGASLAEELHSVEELQSVEELGASPRGGDLGLREASRSLELRHWKAQGNQSIATRAGLGAAAAAMAMVSRLLSRSRQLYAGQIFFQHDHGMPVRSYAKEASASNLPPLKGDEMLRNIFYDVKNKFETAFSVLRKEKITIDPDDPAAVSQYAKVIETIREKADLLSESQKIKYAIDLQTQDIPDARTYLNGLADDIGAEPLMMEALEKVEKEIKKPLLRSDKKNMSLLLAEFDKVNKKLGIKKEDLPKYEEQLELKVAKEDLDGLKKDAIEAMETQLKREEFKDEEMVDVKSLDIRNFF